jgi:protein SCO1/2
MFAMRRRELLRLMSLSWLSGLALFIRPTEGHKEQLGRNTAGRQTVQIPAPTFTLTDQEGQPFVFQSWRGRAILVTFGFTTCQDVCPILATNVAVIQRELIEADRPGIRILFITTDPEHDRPEVLRAYGAQLGADFSSWTFVTGSPEELRLVWKGFGVSVQRRGPGQVDHTTLTTIVDNEGIRRVNYYGTRWRPEAVIDDLVAWAPGGPNNHR